MSTIVIYSGQARSFAQTFANQYWWLLRHLDDPQFYVSVADDAQAPDMVRMLRTRFPEDRIHFEAVTQPTLPEPVQPEGFMGYPASVPPQAILRQLWSLQRAWEFVTSNLGTGINGNEILRIRPDIAFTRLDRQYRLLHPDSCFTPWWGRWGGVNDRLASIGVEAADCYFKTFSAISRLMAAGCPLHPETLIAAQLESCGIIPDHTLATEFVTVRMDGTQRPADITMIDVVEYARTRA